jgi:sugar phosphate isomerase/epimerase
MLKNVYISTSAFKNIPLNDLCRQCFDAGLTNIELSFVSYADDIRETVFEYKKMGMNFLVHNYFPRPKEDFVLNLGSDDPKVEEMSVAHCRKAIDLSQELGAPFYSVHAGFAFHAAPEDLGRKLTELRRIPYHKVYERFIRNVGALAEYGHSRGVKLAIENNVLTEFNLIDGRNELILFVEAHEGLDMQKAWSSCPVGFLIDMGHVNVSSRAMGFDREEFLRAVSGHVAAYHLSDNDGRTDQTAPFGRDVWFADWVKAEKNKTFVIELQNVDVKQIKGCYEVLEKILIG